MLKLYDHNYSLFHVWLREAKIFVLELLQNYAQVSAKQKSQRYSVASKKSTRKYLQPEAHWLYLLFTITEYSQFV